VLPADVGVLDGKERLAVVVKDDDRYRRKDALWACGHASRSRMLKGNACIVGVDVAM
jgi:hypothetical protein